MPPPPRRDNRQGRGRGRGRFVPRRKVCAFCVEKVQIIDYKDIARMRRYISDRYRMEPRRKTGVCARHQRSLSTAIKRARHIALVPFTPAHVKGNVASAFRAMPAAPQPAPAGSTPQPTPVAEPATNGEAPPVAEPAEAAEAAETPAAS